MDSIIHPKILEGFGLTKDEYIFNRYGAGLINNTFQLKSLSENKEDLILQRINTNVFTKPWIIAKNNREAANYLAEHHPDYLFVAPIQTVEGKDLLHWKGEYWRLMPFVENTTTINEANNPKQAFEAAKQFGKLIKNLSGINTRSLKPTIPDFHNLTLRYNSFQSAIMSAVQDRKEAATDLIDAFQDLSGIAVTYEKLKTESDFKDRLIHHDTKISNVLLDKNTYEGVCVIDLDTLMPGKIISDIGDMIRTYVSPASEEETDFSKIKIREEYYDALMEGYLSQVGSDLTATEKESLFYSGQFMIYMQGIRFLTDYLNGDTYYAIKYPEHNLNRAKNQLTLLRALNAKKSELQSIIDQYL